MSARRSAHLKRWKKKEWKITAEVHYIIRKNSYFIFNANVVLKMNIYSILVSKLCFVLGEIKYQNCKYD